MLLMASSKPEMIDKPAIIPVAKSINVAILMHFKRIIYNILQLKF